LQFVFLKLPLVYEIILPLNLPPRVLVNFSHPSFRIILRYFLCCLLLRVSVG
jgi:hypothetical protein